MNPGEDHRIPLLIGVTGHRDIVPADRASIVARVEAFFHMVRAEFPHTPMRLYSGIAAGADQLVAEVAASLDIPVVPVLPLPASIYAADFANDPDALARFHEILGTYEPVVLGTSDDAAMRNSTDHYALLASFLAVRCQIVLALWDGTENEEVGGTAFAVNAKLFGRLDADTMAAGRIESGLVYHVPIRRRLAPDRTVERDDRFLAAAEIGPYLEALREIEEYNTAVARDATDRNAANHAFEQADVLAMKMQRYVRAVRIAIFSCLGVLVLSYAAYSDYNESFVELGVYLGALLVGGMIWFLGQRSHVERRYLDYRTLAEALRIQAMWSKSGLTWSVADVYLRKHRRELRWIRFALRGFSRDASIVALLTDRRSIARRETPILDEVVVRAWIEEQHRYYARSASARDRRLAGFQRLIAALYTLGVGMAIVALALQSTVFWPSVRIAIVILMGVLPAFAGLIGAWTKQVALAEEAARARGMESLFATALIEWDHPRNRSDRAAIAEDLGKEALHENADWLALRRERPIEAPLGSG